MISYVKEQREICEVELIGHVLQTVASAFNAHLDQPTNNGMLSAVDYEAEPKKMSEAGVSENGGYSAVSAVGTCFEDRLKAY